MDNSSGDLSYDCLRYRPYNQGNSRFKIKRAKYSTSLDPRGFIPVYEYTINGQPIMWDRETGYVHFTGIWKSLGNSKSDIVKMVDSNPELKVKKIRGGFLKIQGTWIPYNYALILCKRTAFNVKKELVPIFGPTFPNSVLDPSHPEYGCLLLDPQSAAKTPQQRRSSYTILRQNKREPGRRARAMRSLNRPLSPTPSATQVQHDRVASSMSVARLLNTSDHCHGPHEDDMDEDEEDEEDEDTCMSDMGDSNTFAESPTTTPSPTFRVIQTFPPPTERPSGPLLPPIYNAPYAAGQPVRHCSEPRITPVIECPLSPPPGSGITISATTSSSVSSVSTCSSTSTNTTTLHLPSSNPLPKVQDIIDTISATILLQRLSQDDGARPFRPIKTDSIPSKVIVGNQEFTICWDNE